MADLVAYLYSVRYFAESGDPAGGRRLVADKGCLGCHSLDGAGGRVAGDLARVKGLDAPGTVIAALWNHSFIMEHRAERRKVSLPKLRPEEMADLVAFLQSQGRPR
jgi:mono/diheme cytochrome c family protein